MKRVSNYFIQAELYSWDITINKNKASLLSFLCMGNRFSSLSYLHFCLVWSTNHLIQIFTGSILCPRHSPFLLRKVLGLPLQQWTWIIQKRVLIWLWFGKVFVVIKLDHYSIYEGVFFFLFLFFVSLYVICWVIRTLLQFFPTLQNLSPSSINNGNLKENLCS